MIAKLEKKIIIISLGLFVVVSFLFLAFIEQRQQNPDYQKDWWVLYFSDIKSPNLNFVIENHNTTSNFHWSATSGKDKPLKEGDVEIKKGASQEVVVEVGTTDDRKITIRVSDDVKAKEIYKDFRK